MTASRALGAALRALSRALRTLRRPYMLIGGMAVIARGVIRVTRDVDATVWAEGLDVEDALSAFKRFGILPRILRAADFARERQVLLLVHRSSETPLDVSLAWLPFEKTALDRAEELLLEGTRIPVVSIEDLIVYKVIAWRERDRTDVERLIVRHRRDVNLARVRRHVAEFARLLESPERIAEFDRVVRRAVPHRKRRRVLR